MKFYKHKAKYIIVTLSIFFLLANQAYAQEVTSYSWSDSINEGDKFTWNIDSIIESNQYVNEENSTFTTMQTNSTSTQFNETVTTTTTISYETTDVQTTTVIETETGEYYNKINNGSKVTVEVLEDPSSYQITAPLFENEGFGESSPLNDYFDYRIDGEINYYLFPVFILIIPVEVHNGITDNFFENELKSDENTEFEEGNKSIENGVFYLREDSVFADNFSSSEMSAEVTWNVKTGVMLGFEWTQSYSDKYSIEYYELKLSLASSINETPGVELELPVSNISIFSVLLIPILRKIRNND